MTSIAIILYDNHSLFRKVLTSQFEIVDRLFCSSVIGKAVFVHVCKNLTFQKQSLEVFFKKGVLKNFAKFTGIYLC